MTRKGKTVLIVDDDSDIVEAISTLVTQCRCKAVGAANWKEMEEQLENFTPSLLIMDVGLPEQDGFELVEKFKKNENCAKVPVIVMTAYAENDIFNMREKSNWLGVVEFVPKPFRSEEFTELLKKHLKIYDLDD